jgi:integrase-like protein
MKRWRLLGLLSPYKTRDLAKADVFDYIEVFYNRIRRDSHLGGVSPEVCERASLSGLHCIHRRACSASAGSCEEDDA